MEEFMAAMQEWDPPQSQQLPDLPAHDEVPLNRAVSFFNQYPPPQPQQSTTISTTIAGDAGIQHTEYSNATKGDMTQQTPEMTTTSATIATTTKKKQKSSVRRRGVATKKPKMMTKSTNTDDASFAAEERSFHDFVQTLLTYERLGREDRKLVAVSLLASMTPAERLVCSSPDRKSSRDLLRNLCHGSGTNLDRAREILIEKLAAFGLPTNTTPSDATMLKLVDLWYVFAAPRHECAYRRSTVAQNATESTKIPNRSPVLGAACQECVHALLRMCRTGLNTEMIRLPATTTPSTTTPAANGRSATKRKKPTTSSTVVVKKKRADVPPPQVEVDPRHAAKRNNIAVAQATSLPTLPIAQKRISIHNGPKERRADYSADDATFDDSDDDDSDDDDSEDYSSVDDREENDFPPEKN